MKTLVHEDHNLLSEPCIPFSRLAPPIDAMQLHDELLESMHHFGGVGLSSNQIGYKYKVFSMIHDDKDMVLYNPEIIEESEEMVIESEGCLSYPGLFIKMSRPKSVSASWENADGQSFSGYFSELSARIFLHEMDHMDGIDFTSRAKKMHLDIAKRKVKRAKLKLKRAHGKDMLAQAS